MRSYVFVHGGNCTAAIWSRLTPRLQGRALAVDLPGRNDEVDHPRASFDVWADAVVADMDRAQIQQAIVVGHSMGGGTLAALARRHAERVAGMVFFSAVVPPDGEPFLHGLSERQQAFMWQHRAAGHTTIPRHTSAEDVTTSPDRIFVRNAGSSEALAPFFEKVLLSGLAGKRVGYVKLLRDRSLPLERQELFIARLRALTSCETRVVDGSHMAMVGHPDASAAAIEELGDVWGL